MMKASEIDPFRGTPCREGVLAEATAHDNASCMASQNSDTSTVSKSPKEGVLLLEHAYRVGEERVVCRLYHVLGVNPFQAKYRLEMEGMDTSASSMLGSDREAARAFYDALVRNTVTPCALEDVLEDWRELHPPVGLWT